MEKNNNTDHQVMIFQPAKYPAELLTSLRNGCDKVREIDEAFFACIQHGNSDTQPKIIIALTVTGELEQIVPMLISKMDKVDFDMSTVEFAYANKGSFQQYFARLSPFYVK